MNFVISPDHKNFQEAQEFICEQLNKELERLANYQILGSGSDSFSCRIENDFIRIYENCNWENLPLSEAAAMLQLKDFNPGIDIWTFFHYVKNDSELDNCVSLLKDWIRTAEPNEGIEMLKADIDRLMLKSAKYREEFLPFVRLS